MNWTRDRLRIVDANLDRSAEGLRTAEDLARFHLEDARLCERIRSIRRSVSRAVAKAVPAQHLVGSRDSKRDVGRGPTGTSRAGALDIARSSFRRTQEAMRVIEEAFRTIQPSVAADIEEMRYRAYEAEKALICVLSRRKPLDDALLYLILGSQNCGGRLVEVVSAAIRGGVDIVQYREKNLPDGPTLENARRLLDLCREHDVPFIVNDRPDMAMIVGAEGVHVGHEDMPPGAVRSFVGDGMMVGFSTHSPEEAERAAGEPVDYIGVGPCFETPTKPGRAAAGLEYVRRAAEAELPVPFFAIGGVNLENVDKVLEAGARKIAVVRAIAGAEDPEGAARGFKERLKARIEDKGKP